VQILSIFPNTIVQQIHNCLAVRQILPAGIDRTELHWTYFGYADDSPDMRTRRLRHLNLGGPAGYVSMEDGCVGGFVERGIATTSDRDSILEMGGAGTDSQQTRATESAVRGFWGLWRQMVGV